MLTQKHQPKSDFIKNIEEAIKEHGNLACPNPKCNHKLISKKKVNSNGNPTLEYHCQNETCIYHQKRQIPLGIETSIPSQEAIPFLANVTYPKIFTVAGLILFGILTYTGYQLYAINSYIDNEMTEHKEAKKKINQNISPYAPLEKEQKLISNSIVKEPQEKVKSTSVDIISFTQQTRTWIASKNYAQGKKNFQKLLNNKDYQKALLQSKHTQSRNQLLHLIANSYEKEGTPFTLHLLKTKQDFALLQDFIKTFDQDQKLKNTLLGKAYLNFPNFLTETISIEDRKKMQLLGLKFYLEAVKEGHHKSFEKSSISAINEIAKAYRIFKHNPKKPKNFLTIEKLIKQGKRDMIQYRIEYVESILSRIS